MTKLQKSSIWLGEQNRIVGVSGFTRRPREARLKPKVSAFNAQKWQDERYRSTILEVAKYREVLIPNCEGAYMPARLAIAHAERKIAGAM